MNFHVKHTRTAAFFHGILEKQISSLNKQLTNIVKKIKVIVLEAMGAYLLEWQGDRNFRFHPHRACKAILMLHLLTASTCHWSVHAQIPREQEQALSHSGLKRLSNTSCTCSQLLSITPCWYPENLDEEAMQFKYKWTKDDPVWGKRSRSCQGGWQTDEVVWGKRKMGLAGTIGCENIVLLSKKTGTRNSRRTGLGMEHVKRKRKKRQDGGDRRDQVESMLGKKQVKRSVSSAALPSGVWNKTKILVFPGKACFIF